MLNKMIFLMFLSSLIDFWVEFNSSLRSLPIKSENNFSDLFGFNFEEIQFLFLWEQR